MFGTSKIVSMFRQQFEADGDAYIYRRSSKGAAYRVSASECEEFVATFRKQILWLMLGGPFVLIGLLVLPAILGFGVPSQMAMLIVTLVIFVLYLLVFYRCWNAPERQLQRRVPVAPPLSAEAARRSALKRVTWGNLAVATVMVPFLALQHLSPAELLMPENRLWLGLVLAGLGFLAFQAYRKWRAESEPDDGGNRPIT